MYCLLNHTTKDATIMVMLCRMVLQAMHNNTVFSAKYLAGVLNITADALSRFQLSRALEATPDLARLPMTVSASFFPWRSK